MPPGSFSPGNASGKTPKQAIHHSKVIQSLRQQQAGAELAFGTDHDIPIVVIDELVAIYAQFGYEEELEAAAGDGLERIARREAGGAIMVGEFGQWRKNLRMELAAAGQRRQEAGQSTTGSSCMLLSRIECRDPMGILGVSRLG
jgi:hypothetical protein